ncbi:histidine phosphatase family protein [Marinomonas spartinae]|uniref:histidine phosphatase family protein n=1 Tax=Marinomonas spartinae TaxID=1792290 RepID=UPI0018F2307F|nr:histidine phosphatase family protein [Marinomonas spartinae]MBJ7555180.1 histidine phosphatase family protein [Marinomonas spartinae]
MTARFALIRHGAYQQLTDVPSALQPFPLTAEGEEEVRRQARAFAQWLTQTNQRLNPVVDTSTLLRAFQTGGLYIEELRPFFLGEPRIHSTFSLCERSVGAVANLTIKEIERILALDPRFDLPPENWKSNSEYCLPFDGAESLNQAGKRVADHICSWHAKAEAGIKLFIGHGAAFRHGACHLNVINFCDIKRFSMHYGHPIVMEFADNQAPNRLYGEWKQRQIQDVPD